MNTEVPDVHDIALPLVTHAFRQIHVRYENRSLHLLRLFFHNTSHTQVVVERATKIAIAMGLSEREVILTQIAAAFHDVFQDRTQILKDGEIRLLQRFAGLNETTSAFEAVQQMHLAPTLFTGFEMGLVSSAIIATIPGWSVEHSTVVQPFLTPSSHPVVRAVALADLGSAGMDSAGFATEGYKFFAEDQLDITERLPRVNLVSQLFPGQEQQYRERLVAWLRTQSDFARGRRAFLLEELRGLSPEQHANVRALFSHFDESIKLADEVAREAESMDFIPLMRRVNPDAFPLES